MIISKYGMSYLLDPARLCSAVFKLRRVFGIGSFYINQRPVIALTGHHPAIVANEPSVGPLFIWVHGRVSLCASSNLNTTIEIRFSP